MNLQGKTAIVSGASSGLGSAISHDLVNKGVKVYGIARNEEALSRVKFQLGELFHPIVLDVTDFQKVNQWIHTNFSQINAPDILINNAAVGGFKKIDEISLEDWLSTINTNLNALFYLTSQLTPFFKEKENSSHIINIGSILGTVGQAEATAYCSSKFAVQGFSDALFKELRNFNIKVTCINPGSIETDFFKNSGIESHQNMLQAKDLAHTIVHVLETPDNFLINELTIRPLNPKK